jgi:hypothetical protein
MATKTNILKNNLINALEIHLGIVTSAYNNDSKFKEKVDELQNVALDFVESKLFDQITNDNPTSTIFYLKTKGKKRGYIEQQILEHKGGIESKLIEWKPVGKKQ